MRLIRVSAMCALLSGVAAAAGCAKQSAALEEQIAARQMEIDAYTQKINRIPSLRAQLGVVNQVLQSRQRSLAAANARVAELEAQLAGK